MRVSPHYGHSGNLLSRSEVVRPVLLQNSPCRRLEEGNSNLRFRSLAHRWVLHPKYIPGTSNTSYIYIKLYFATSADVDPNISLLQNIKFHLPFRVWCLIYFRFSDPKESKIWIRSIVHLQGADKSLARPGS